MNQIRRSLNEAFPVRLACVKHAASVHPEPGSNSLIKCLIHSRQPTSYLSFYCFWFIQPFLNNEVRFLRTEPHSHLSMLMCKEFSRIVCVSLFSYQGCSLSVLCDSLFILPHLFSFVKNFFQVFFKVFRTLSVFRNTVLICDCRLCSSDLITLTYLFQVVKHFFNFFFSFRNHLKLSHSKKQLFPTARLIYH